MSVQKPRLYRGNADDMHAAGMPSYVRFVKAGYSSTPLKGQWYLSGAKPCAYRAPNNLSGAEFPILYPVREAAPGYANPIYVPPPQ